MEWVEITAKTIEEAKERALDELGIDHDEVEFVIVEEPKRGLFGNLRAPARVRARVAPKTPRAKTDRRGKRSRPTSGDGDRRGSRTRSKNTSDAHRSDADKSDADKSDADKSGPVNNRGSQATPTSKSEVAGRQATKRGEKSRTSTSAKSKSSAQKKSAQEKSTQSAENEGNPMSMNLDEQVAATETFVQGLLEAIGFDARVSTVRVDDANARVNIEGDDIGVLIGPRGQTISAIQDLARINLQKQAAGSWEGHVHVDVNGYRAKRREALVAFVEKIAAEVAASGTPKALEPMSSSDRKVVHDTVNGLDGVRTSSEGYEPRRWVKISPDAD